MYFSIKIRTGCNQERKPSPIASHIVKNSVGANEQVHQRRQMRFVSQCKRAPIKRLKLRVANVEPNQFFLAPNGHDKAAFGRKRPEFLIKQESGEIRSAEQGLPPQ